jgi:hypothetical protein
MHVGGEYRTEQNLPRTQPLALPNWIRDRRETYEFSCLSAINTEIAFLHRLQGTEVKTPKTAGIQSHASS